MVEEKNLPERLVELAIYVPVGIAATVIEELPFLAERGRQKVSSQVEMAKMIGKLAVSQAQRRVRPPSSEGTDGRVPPAPPRPGASAPATRHRVSSDETPRPRPARAAKAAPPGAPATAEAPKAASLPIPGYDTLAASQVVQRLSSLRPDELDAVRRYEVATRGRRTILHRIAQLSSEASA